MKTKKLALLLAVIIASSTVLAACASDDKTNSSSASPSSASPSSVAGEAVSDGSREMVGNMYTTGLPIVKEQETFSLFSDGGKAEDYIMYPILQEQTNVKVDLMLYPYEIATEKLNILINSGKYPDAIGGWLLSDNDILKNGMTDKLYIPIDESIEKYAPKMQEILAIEDVRETMTLPDGHIYTIPYITGTPLVPYLPWINTEWLDKVGMKMPTTPAEFKEVLMAFKTKDPNGNGKADEIPFTSEKNNLNLGLLTGWWGVSVPQGANMGGFAMIDGKLEYTATSDEYKELIKFLADLHKNGLIDPEIFTQDGTQWKAKGIQGLYGCTISYGSGDFHEGLKPGERTKYDALPVLKAEGVEKPVYKRNSNGAAIMRTQMVITDNAKNPDTIIRWYDNVFEIDNSMQIKAGLFGKRLEKLGEGDYRYLDENLLSESDRIKYGWGNMFTQSLPNYAPLDLVIKPAVGTPELYDEKKVADKLYEPFLDEKPAQVWVSADDSKKISALSVSIATHVEEKLAEWVSNQADVEKEWDGYKKQLDKIGLQELIKMRQTAQESAKK